MKATGLPFKVLDDKVETTSGFASIATMHIAKGLEFRAVVVMACDDEVIPLHPGDNEKRATSAHEKWTTLQLWRAPQIRAR